MQKKEHTRKKVEYYNDYQINHQVLRKTNIIDLKRIKEGITIFSMEKVKNLKQVTKGYKAQLKDIYIILGEDWYLAYTIKGDKLDIKDWIAVHNVDNKFAQTSEMMHELKKVLLENSNCNITSILRHSTSYQFYKKLLDEGFIEEQNDEIDFDDYTPKLEEINYQILDKYDSLEDYLQDDKRERYEEYHIEDFIYHEVEFTITKKFINRYKKSGR